VGAFAFEKTSQVARHHPIDFHGCETYNGYKVEKERGRKMTDTQKAALRKLDNGILRINGEWVWPEDVRESEATARMVLEAK
jgi:hypothetical protein